MRKERDSGLTLGSPAGFWPRAPGPLSGPKLGYEFLTQDTREGELYSSPFLKPNPLFFENGLGDHGMDPFVAIYNLGDP
jgi:hypothetical protein